MNNGWIKTYRRTLKSSVWKRPIIWWVWSWCLMKANHQPNNFPFNDKDIEVKAGQFITGRKIACKELKLTPQKYRSAILYLKNTRRITTQSTNQFTIITILNWRKYQPIDLPTNQPTNQRITNEQPTDNQRITTNKNVKNDKNEKNILAKANKVKKITNDYINSNKRKDIRIILLYAKSKGKEEWTSAEETSFLKRNFRSAKLLEPYSYERIIEVLKWLKDNADFKWTLETVGKYIDEDLPLLKSKLTKDEDVVVPTYARKYQKND